MSHRTSSQTIMAAVLGLGVVAAVGMAGGCQTPYNSQLRESARLRMKEGNMDAAEALARQAVDQDASDWRAQKILGEACLQQAKWIDAQLHLEQALMMLPGLNKAERPAILDGIAEAIHQQGRADALTGFLKQTAERYQTPRDYIRQAKYLAKLNDVDGSRLALRKAARLASKNNPEPYLLLADYYQSIGDSGRSLVSLRQAYYVAPYRKDIAQRLREGGIEPGPEAGLPPEE